MKVAVGYSRMEMTFGDKTYEGWLLVFLYDPAGNMVMPGYYEDNVQPLKSSGACEADTTEEPTDTNDSGTDDSGNPDTDTPAGDNEVATVTVDEHNKFRALHCNTADVAYDHEMEVLAQKIADKKVFKHSSRDERNGAGENLAWNMEPTIGAAIAKGVKNFYSEIEFYQWDNPGNDGIGGEAVGHFTQVIKNCPLL